MNNRSYFLDNENGTVIFVAIVFLALLTLVGVSSISTSTTEVRIASNTQYNKVEFYIADSGLKQGAVWLNDHPSPPIYKNITGSGKNYKRHFYRVDSNANRTQDVEAVVSKVYKTGYN